MRFLFLSLCCLCFVAPSLRGQEAHTALTNYINEYNADHAMCDWIRVEHAPVSLRINENEELEAFVSNGRELRIVLQRDEADELDYLFPLHITNATLVFAGETILVLDDDSALYVALTIATEPRLPDLEHATPVVFTGYGLGQHWSNNQ